MQHFSRQSVSLPSKAGASVLKVLGISAIIIVAMIGGCVACTATVVGAAVKGHEANQAKLAENAAGLLSAKPSDLRADGDLAQIFTIGSKHTEIQREEKLRAITGKVVEWTLPVYEISKDGDHYKVQTGSSLSGTGPVSCFVHIYPQSDADTQALLRLTEKMPVHFRGIIEGDSFRSLVIRPAIIVQ